MPLHAQFAHCSCEGDQASVSHTRLQVPDDTDSIHSINALASPA